jgi:hypothetical protein
MAPRPSRLATAYVDRLLDDSRRRLDSHPRELLAIRAGQLACDTRQLKLATKRLDAGVYLRGPRRGQAYDARTRAVKAAWIHELAARIADMRGEIARLERAGAQRWPR